MGKTFRNIVAGKNNNLSSIYAIGCLRSHFLDCQCITSAWSRCREDRHFNRKALAALLTPGVSTKDSVNMSSTKCDPLYISKPSARSLWQEYRIYHDRLELRFWLFLKILNIPASKIIDVKTVPSAFQRKKNSKFVAWLWGLFLDWAAFHRHVLVETKSYFARYLHFTPDDPDTFVNLCKTIIK
jgi:hypothetical protein